MALGPAGWIPRFRGAASCWVACAGLLACPTTNPVDAERSSSTCFFEPAGHLHAPLVGWRNPPFPAGQPEDARVVLVDQQGFVEREVEPGSGFASVAAWFPRPGLAVTARTQGSGNVRVLDVNSGTWSEPFGEGAQHPFITRDGRWVVLNITGGSGGPPLTPALAIHEVGDDGFNERHRIEVALPAWALLAAHEGSGSLTFNLGWGPAWDLVERPLVRLEPGTGQLVTLWQVPTWMWVERWYSNETHAWALSYARDAAPSDFSTGRRAWYVIDLGSGEIVNEREGQLHLLDANGGATTDADVAAMVDASGALGRVDLRSPGAAVQMFPGLPAVRFVGGTAENVAVLSINETPRRLFMIDFRTGNIRWSRPFPRLDDAFAAGSISAWNLRTDGWVNEDGSGAWTWVGSDIGEYSATAWFDERGCHLSGPGGWWSRLPLVFDGEPPMQRLFLVDRHRSPMLVRAATTEAPLPAVSGWARVY